MTRQSVCGVCCVLVTTVHAAEIDIVQKITERCDGVILVEESLPGNTIDSSVTFITPDGSSRIYAELRLGHVVEYGTLDASPRYVNTPDFNFEDWLDELLAKRGYAGWGAEDTGGCTVTATNVLTE